MRRAHTVLRAPLIIALGVVPAGQAAAVVQSGADTAPRTTTTTSGADANARARQREDDRRRERRRRDDDEDYRMRVRDLRIEGGTFAKPFHVTEKQVLFDQTTGYNDFDLSGASAQRVALAVHRGNLYRYGGFVWSVGFEYVWGEYDAPVHLFSAPRTLDYRMYGPCMQMGYGYAITRWLDVELSAIGSAWWAGSDWNSSFGIRQSTSGMAGDIGGRLGVYACGLEHFVAGAQVDYTRWTALINAGGDRESDLQLKARGWGIQGMLGIRF